MPPDQHPGHPLHAAIDVGSHSAKLRLAHRTGDGRWRSVDERVVVTGLGAGGPGRLDPDGRRRTLDALRTFADIIAEQEVRRVAAVGTMILRQARDADGFVAEVRRLTGLPLDVIPGEEEARLTYLGAAVSLPVPTPRDGVIAFDIGGASTEIAWGDAHLPAGRRSLPIGTITMAVRHELDRAVSPAAADSAIADAASHLATVPDHAAGGLLVGIGATCTSLVAMDAGRDIADSMEVHGRALAPETVAAWIERLRRLEAADRRRLPGLHPQRDRVILAGAVLTAAVQRRWPGIPTIVSTCGLRLGLLADRFPGER